MVFQNYALYPHMTVEENLGFGLKLRRVPKDGARDAASARSRATLGLEDADGAAARRSSPAASASASRWAGRWCASRRRS